MKKEEMILDIYFDTTGDYTVRTEQLNGKPHLVVPVVMMTEGVRSGSHGPILHLAEELGRYPESWDGIPVTIGHPSINGQYVSANQPAVLEDWGVGLIFNTRLDGNALRAEAWLDEEDLQRVSEDVLERINNNRELEVSIGIYSDEETTSGTWDNQQYNAIARNHRPNHLALLPDEIGACSIKDGCGIRVNQKGESNVAGKEKTIITNENRSQVLKSLNREGFSINALGYTAIREKIAATVYALDTGGHDNYVEEIYDDYFVYTQFNNRVEPRTRKMYKQTYSFNTANDVELSGEPIHVKKEVSYEAIPNVNGKVKTKRVIQKNKSMCTDCVEKLAAALIANKATAWTKDDKEYLEAQSEEQLEKMTPTSEKPQVNTNAKETPLTRKAIMEVLSAEPLDNDEFLNLVSPEMRAQFKEGSELRVNAKTKMVSEIVANSDQWTEDELNEKSLSEVTKLHKVVTKDLGESAYVASGNLGGRTQVNNGGHKNTPKTSVMLPAGVKVKDSK